MLLMLPPKVPLNPLPQESTIAGPSFFAIQQSDFFRTHLCLQWKLSASREDGSDVESHLDLLLRLLFFDVVDVLFL